MTGSTPAKNPSDLPLRAGVALALFAMAMAGLVLGGAIYWLLCCALAIGMAWEWGRLTGLRDRDTRLLQFTLCVPLAIIGPLGAGPGFFTLGLVAGAALFLLAVLRPPWPAFGIVYLGIPVLALILIRDQPRGLSYSFWALALVWACDIGAYFAGRRLGGPRLAPAVSPNKTWAGFGGGVLAATLFGAVMHLAVGLPWRLTLATPLLAVIAQIGDLFESWLKRQAGVKDSGAVLPGHGGLMDRMDGVVAVAPFAALLVVLPQIRGLMGQ